ncbi:hypothetical protein [Hymenobacter jeollabukensis]|uniref:DUF2490 domain-containing protein n=1 Tax=Hymenobacter jeollabukensis TaxID=2025313 RepID=A0A5R8WSP4_9BACT|nr:hypothetical protein [Hymenobacter jeollabukensis]TLM94203.1 hypothetical protein FDY95_09315 [Hymenobacter jeollabukensis]
MLRFSFATLCLAACALAARAQAPDTTTTHRHELGLTASPVLNRFFTRNRALPVGLLYKRRLGTGGRALRLGAQGSYQRQQRDDPYWPTVNDDFDYRTTQLELSAGLEWVRPLGRRWAVAAGADVGAGYRREYRYRLTFNTGNTGIRDQNGNPVPVYEEEEFTFTYRTAVLRPFTALRLYVTPWLYTSFEAAVTGSFTRFRTDGSARRVRTDTNEAYIQTYNGSPLYREDAWNLRLQLLCQVTVHYCFGR